MISLRHVSKQFSNGFKALDSVDLTVKPGEIFGVIGRSGAGKSTLLRCVNFLEQPTQGEVLINGQLLNELDAKELQAVQSQMGMIFQHFHLLSSRTVFGNIALPLEIKHHDREDIQRRVDDLLALVGLTEFAECYPSALSGGQKQRVAIARALANQPTILLCDEATSALDPETTQSILALLKDINQKLNLTILLITHEMSVIQALCDRVALMEAGKIIEQCSTLDFFLHPQTSLARTFADTVLKQRLPRPLAGQLSEIETPNSKLIIRLIFSGEVTERPMIYDLVKRFKMAVNILQAEMDQVGGVSMGVMIVEITEGQSQLPNAIRHLKQYQVDVEILGYVTH